MGPWPFPPRDVVLENPRVRLSAVDPAADVEALWAAASVEANGTDLFRYHVNVPPMTDREVFQDYLEKKAGLRSEVLFQVFSKRLGRPVGCVSLMNLRPEHGVLEVGSIWYAKVAQRTEVNTNTMLLLFTWVFEVLGYRRLEWKCNNANEDSKRAALRLGFGFEGLFRHHMVSRGESRDTAWYALLGVDWPEKKPALAARAGF